MTQFHEGQDVEVNGEHVDMPRWEKAKIVKLPHSPNALDDGRKFTVQFSDSTRAVVDADNIRALKTSAMTADDNGRIVRGY